MMNYLKNRRLPKRMFSVMLVMRETFILILPLYLLMSILDLAMTLVSTHTNQTDLYFTLQQISNPVKRALPFVVTALLGYKLAKFLKMEPTLVGATSGVSLAVALWTVRESGEWSTESILPSVYSIILPLWTVFLYGLVRRLRFLSVDVKVVSHLLAGSLNGIVPTILVVLVNAFAFHALSASLVAGLESAGDALNHLPLLVQGSIRIIAVHALWFIGIHGNYVYTSLTYGNDLAQVVVDGFTLGSLLNTFVLFGGAGGTLAMLLAIALRRRTMREQLVAKISLPLQFFNINDILLFGYPIVLNPYLLVPFIAFPLLGFWLAYAAAVFNLLPLTENVHWIVPFGLNAWTAGGGSIVTVIFQLVMLVLGAAIYYPFLAWENGDEIKKNLRRVFARDDLPEARLDVPEDAYVIRQKSALQSHAQAMEAFRLLAEGTLELWYQPQVEVRTMQVYGFEALLRLRMADGKIIGPWFIPKLESAGYSDVLNSWVINRAIEDLGVWQEDGFSPRISINLTADFLASDEKVTALLAQVEKRVIDLNLEMLESSFTEKFADLAGNIELLRSRGLTLSIDDFGTGYSNLGLLHKIGIDSVKLDRSLIADIGKPRGQLLYQELCNLLKAFGYRLVAEGVETEEQLAFVRQCKVDIVQGWYFSQALPPALARTYAPAAASSHSKR